MNECLDQLALKLGLHHDHLLSSTVSVSVGLRRGLSVCIFNKSPSHADATGSGSLFLEPFGLFVSLSP